MVKFYKKTPPLLPIKINFYDVTWEKMNADNNTLKISDYITSCSSAAGFEHAEWSQAQLRRTLSVCISSDVIVLLNTSNKNSGHPSGSETANVESGSQSRPRSYKNLLPPSDHRSFCHISHCRAG